MSTTNKRSSSGSQQEGSSSTDTENTVSGAPSSFPSSSLSPFSSKRAAETYGNAKMELGSGGESDSGNGSTLSLSNSTGSALLSEIREGAERLANELDEYLAKGSEKGFVRDKGAPPLSDEAVADLQLATARKLREVSRRNDSIRVCTLFIMLPFSLRRGLANEITF